jgi:predicted MPP superfamily phosphohydrolase
VVLPVLIVVLLGGLVVGRRSVVNTTTIPLGLPTPLRVAVLADMHISAGEEGRAWGRRAIAVAMREKPDVILLLGDFVAHRNGVPYVGDLVAGVQAPLGVYAVLGNHDHWEDAGTVTAQLEAEGVQVLTNRHVVIRKGDTRLALVGIDDLWAGDPDWQAAYRGAPKGVPILLMSHNPDAAIRPEGQRAALIVSGHTHGGQVRVPFTVRWGMRRIVGIGWPPGSTYGLAHPYGLIREGPAWVYITSGVVRRFVVPRWFTEAEVAVLELK